MGVSKPKGRVSPLQVRMEIRTEKVMYGWTKEEIFRRSNQEELVIACKSLHSRRKTKTNGDE